MEDTNQMEDPLIPRDTEYNDESGKFRGRKNASQVILADNKQAKQMKEPQGLRRQFLIEQATRRGIPYKAVPITWKIPFFKALEELDLVGLAELVGGEYKMTQGSGTLLTFFSLIKGMITTGILFVPGGFLLGGWLFSSAVLIVIGIICTITMSWLSGARDLYGGSFSDLAGAALGKFGYYFVEFSIFTTQLGFVVVGGVFVNNNLVQTLHFFEIEIGLWTAGLIQFLGVAPLLVLRKMTELAITHVIADFIILLNIIYIAVNVVVELGEQGAPGANVQPFNSVTCILMLGMAVYMFEGISLVLPIKQAMKEPTQFNSVLYAIMSICTVLLVGMGLISYVAFGENTQQIVTFNLETTTTSSALMLVYLVATLLTHPLTLFPSFTILDAWVGRYTPHFAPMAFRYLLLALMLACSVLLHDKADKYISILGSVFCASLAYIIPSLIHIKLAPDLGYFSWGLAIVFVVAGVAGGVMTLITAITHW